jgi:hypothetical protein
MENFNLFGALANAIFPHSETRSLENVVFRNIHSECDKPASLSPLPPLASMPSQSNKTVHFTSSPASSIKSVQDNIDKSTEENIQCIDKNIQNDKHDQLDSDTNSSQGKLLSWENDDTSYIDGQLNDWIDSVEESMNKKSVEESTKKRKNRESMDDIKSSNKSTRLSEPGDLTILSHHFATIEIEAIESLSLLSRSESLLLEKPHPFQPADSGVYDLDSKSAEKPIPQRASSLPPNPYVSSFSSMHLDSSSSIMPSDASFSSSMSFLGQDEAFSDALDSHVPPLFETLAKSTSLDAFPEFLDISGSIQDDEPTLFQLNSEEEGDPLKLREYAEEIFAYLLEKQKTTLADPHYMDKQPHLTWNMRSVLLDWLIEVHHGISRLVPETLHLAVNLMDRFLSQCSGAILPNKFQLLGAVCFLLAAKYEEIDPPLIAALSQACGDVYTREEFKQAEIYVMNTIKWDVGGGWPNIMEFLRRGSRAEGYDVRTRTVGKYLVELAAIDERFIGIKPSIVAGGAIWVARQVVGKLEPWVRPFFGSRETN